MAFTYAQNQRIGGASVIQIFTYGNAFTTALATITDHQKEGVTVSLETEEISSESGVTPGVNDITDIVKSVSFGLNTAEYNMNNLALSLGLTLAAPTEDAAPVVDHIRVEGGSSFLDTFYEVRIKCPQRTTPTLFDIWDLYKCKFRPAFEQAITVGAYRNANLRLTAIKDAANSGKIYRFYIEGVTA